MAKKKQAIEGILTVQHGIQVLSLGRPEGNIAYQIQTLPFERYENAVGKFVFPTLGIARTIDDQYPGISGNGYLTPDHG
ncbi:MAG: hypothetical protein FI703_09105 [SAR202 cluster bacterium]|nr:hypothetical protein [SAR202 cluster bacterium]